MKHKLLSLFAVLCTMASISHAQNFPGYSSGNYVGVNGVFFNPASIADSRYRWDVNLFSVNATVANNYATFKTKNLTNLINGKDSIKNYISRNNSVDAKLLTDVDIFGPSFMFNVNSRSAIAITSRVRTMLNLDNIPGTLLSSIGKDTTLNLPASISPTSFYMGTNAWAEAGISYARVIKDNRQHFLKGGLTAKLLLGGGAGNFLMDKFSATVDEDVSGNYFIKNGRGTISYGQAGATGNFSNYNFEFNGMGIGADLGLIYEYRPNYEKYLKENDSYRRDKNKYKYKAGVSITDLGAINYNKRAENYAYTLNTSLNPNGSDTMNISNRFDGLEGANEIRNALNNASPMITQGAGNTNALKFKLPTAINLLFDYNVNGNLYVSAEGMLVMNKATSKAGKTHKVNFVTITPRYEGKIFGLYVPVNFNEYSGMNAGLGLRVGFFSIGSGMILSSLIKGETKHVNVYTGIRFGILQKNKKVKKTEAEETVAQVVDTDNDGIEDSKDNCPTVAGLAKYNGCPIPDTDGDGINDEEDKCVAVPGVAKYNGCPVPDKDGDGINDEEDSCIDVPGVAKYKGCPIPDTDGDGINDEEDKCIDVKGIAKYQGCPIPDTDGDGVNDEEDKCIDRPGTVANQGCPEISKQVIQKISYAAKNIFFTTGSDKLLTKSFAPLNEVVKLMKSDESLNLSIEGHTDSQGDDAKNQALSEKRANAVKTYLVSKGIDENRLSTAGFGEIKPVADNATATGRAKNRRTEITVRNF